MRTKMRNGVRLIALLLILGGALGLVYRGVTYTKESNSATVGTVEVSVKEKETLKVPVGVSAGAIAVGALLLLW